MFNVESDSGIASARINGLYMDAGRAGDLAGIEFSVDNMRMSDTPRQQRHANAVVSLDCTPKVMLQMATIILDKLDLPAFNEREWNIIADALRGLATSASFHEAREMADKIDAATAKIAEL